ncbi:MAG: hypothetical protein V3U89_03335 [Methylophilaceae bacterium]
MMINIKLMRKKYFIFICLLVAVLSGCTKEAFYKEAYHATQPSVFSCNEVAQSQYEDCMKRAQKTKTYEAYEKERSKTLKQ